MPIGADDWESVAETVEGSGAHSDGSGELYVAGDFKSARSHQNQKLRSFDGFRVLTKQYLQDGDGWQNTSSLGRLLVEAQLQLVVPPPPAPRIVPDSTSTLHGVFRQYFCPKY